MSLGDIVLLRSCREVGHVVVSDCLQHNHQLKSHRWAYVCWCLTCGKRGWREIDDRDYCWPHRLHEEELQMRNQLKKN